MKLGPIILIIWFLLMGTSVITAIVMAITSGARSLIWGALLVIGSVLLFGFIYTYMGVTEGLWTASSPPALIALPIGCTGAILMLVGVYGLFRT